jgi:hypothetical protein
MCSTLFLLYAAEKNLILTRVCGFRDDLFGLPTQFRDEKVVYSPLEMKNKDRLHAERLSLINFSFVKINFFLIF